MTVLKSRAVAERLGVPYYVLFNLLRNGRLSPPSKDSSGDYVWTEEDVERARAALLARRRPPAVVA
jgi:predicted site-specific integrase-resolvase